MRKKRDWPALIEEQETSGKTINAFCGELGIHPNSFYKYRKRHAAQALVEIPVPRSIPREPILLKFHQYSLAISPGFDPSTLKSLLVTLNEIR